MQDPLETAGSITDTAEFRNIFGANLRQLALKYSSIAELCRQLKVNRTQFNRYLSGESFPRPDVLHRMCQFFDVDARVLLEPVDGFLRTQDSLFNHPKLAEFLGAETIEVPDADLPNGFYRFTRPDFADDTLFLVGLVYVFRKDGHTFIRGYEPREAMPGQGPACDTANREFRGAILRQEQGIAILLSHRKPLTCSFSFLSRVSSQENNLWEGYSTRPARESPNGYRVVRMVYEHIVSNPTAIYRTARNSGIKRRDELNAVHAKLLKPGAPFK